MIIALLNLGAIIAYIYRSNLAVALADPVFKGFFHITPQRAGWLNSAFFWSYAFLQIPAGWLVDRWGVKKPFAVGFLFWSVLSTAIALTTDIRQVFALLFLLGIAESVLTPAAMRWIRFHFAEKQRGLAVGVYMTGTKLGPAIGTLLAARLVAAHGWQFMFVALGLGSLLWLVPWMALVEKDDRGTEPAAASKAAVASITLGRTMASPVIWGTVIGTFCYMYFVYFCMQWMPKYFVEQRHISLNSSGTYTFVSFTGIAVMAALAGWAADVLIARGGDPVRVRKGFTIAGFVMASTEVIGALSSSTSVALFFAVFSLTGLGLATANYWALTQTLIPGGAIGRIVGIQNCAANLPGIVAPLLTGWLVQRTGSYQAPMQAIGFFLVLGVAAYVFLVRQKYAPK